MSGERLIVCPGKAVRRFQERAIWQNTERRCRVSHANK